MNRLRDQIGFVLRALGARLKRARRADVARSAAPITDAPPRPLPLEVLRNLPRAKPRNEFGLRRLKP